VLEPELVVLIPMFHDGFIKPFNEALRVWGLFLFSNSNVFATVLTEVQVM
jgi:hypothetical protein